MNKRRLGKTELQVSEIGYGAWQLGTSDVWGAMSDREALALVRKALDLGCNLFDTAPNYANTHSERLLGKALQGVRDDVVLVTKFGHSHDREADFSEEWMWASLHDSLARLQTDYVDVFLLHSPPPDCQNGAHPVWDAMRRAQEQGKIRFYGASLDDASEIRTCLESSDAQVLEVLFNILHQDCRRAFDRVRLDDVGLIAKVPLDSGWLSGKYDARSRFTGVRSRWAPAEIQQRADLVNQLAWLTEDGTPLPQKALAFLLAYPEVASVIPGVRSQAQLQANLAAAGQSLTRQDRHKLESFWDGFTDDGTQLLPW